MTSKTDRRINVFVISATLALSGCFGGSSSSSDDEQDVLEPIDDSISENGELQPIEGADSRFLFYTKEFRAEDVVGAEPTYLYGVNPATADRVLVSPGAQNNFLERGEAGEEFRVPLTENRPDATTLPLAVKAGDYAPTGAIDDVRLDYVVYNTPEGELYRAAVEPDASGDIETLRISSESDAEVVCAANILSDYSDQEQTVIVYQAARNGSDCSETVWKLVRLYQSDEDEPFVLRDEVDYEDGFTPPDDFVPDDSEDLQGLREHWSFATRDADGAITGIFTFDGDDAENLMWHDPTRPAIEDDVVDDVDTWVRPLGVAGDDGDTVIQLDGLVYSLGDGEGNARLNNMNSEDTDGINEERVDNSLTGPDQAINLDGILYVVDVEDASSDSGRVLAIDPDKGDEQVEILADDDEWGTGFIVSNVTGSTVDGGYLSWAYLPDGCDDDSCKGAIQVLDLAVGTSEAIKEDIEYDFPYRIVSPSAPNDDTPLVFFEDTVPNAVGAVGMNQLGDKYSTNPANWLGQSWSRDQPGSGKLASYVYFADSVDNEFGGTSYVIRARPAENLTNSHDVTFDGSPRQTPESEVSVQGYGSTVLFGFLLRHSLSNYGAVWIGDAEKPESLQPVVDDTDFTARPVPLF